MIKVVAVAKDGGLFIPNFGNFKPNEIIKIDIHSFEILVNPISSNERKLPFEPLPARGVVATDEIVNKIRDEEGI